MGNAVDNMIIILMFDSNNLVYTKYYQIYYKNNTLFSSDKTTDNK